MHNLKTNLFALKVQLIALAVSRRVVTVASRVISSLPWQHIVNDPSAVRDTSQQLLLCLARGVGVAMGTCPRVYCRLSGNCFLCHEECANTATSSQPSWNTSASSGWMSSTVLLYHWFLFIAWLGSFASRHSRKEPSGFLTWRIGFFHSVCSLTSSMSARCVCLPNFAF